MRQVAAACGHYVVCEQDRASMSLAKKEVDGSLEAVHLYEVTVITPLTTTTAHVLAESADSAIDQARCALRLERRQIPPVDAKKFTWHAKRLPLILRGWGGHQF